jgi:hypothetical protein
MLATAAVIAGLTLGLVAGLLAKPDRPQFSPCCGTTLGCTSCGQGGKAARAAVTDPARTSCGQGEEAARAAGTDSVSRTPGN